MENPDKQLHDQFASLPLAIQEAINRIPWETRIKDIAKREGLTDTQTLTLELETRLMLYGITTPDTYPMNIQMQLGVDEEQAERVAGMAEREIVADIKKQFEMISALAPASAQSIPAQTKVDHAPTDTHSEKKADTSATPTALVVGQNILPALEEGEMAHDVPHVESSPDQTPAPSTETEVPAPASDQTPAAETVPMPETVPETTPEIKKETPPAYAPGKDPYREPLE